MLLNISPGLSKTCSITFPCSRIGASETEGNTAAKVFGRFEYLTFRAVMSERQMQS